MIDAKAFVHESVERLKSEIPERTLVAASGGIDSTVAARLTELAVGARARAIFVDTGLLRYGEVERVRQYFHASHAQVEVVEAGEVFLGALEGVTDPEEKRRRVGRSFIRLFEREAVQFRTDRLVQGTIAPDWIESGGSTRDTIKTHHNVGGVPADNRLRLIEPLHDLYKDEVRALARELQIPDADRQPFPGPGLAVRVNGALTPERVHRARVANRIVEEEVDRAVAAGAIARPWQYFAVLLSARTVGVLGDNRVHGEAVSVRVVESIDAMTARSMGLPREVSARIAERITRELSGEVVRVLYDITDKPPATIEWE
ncbi:MAG: glutamine-hydrolyzing GMP synthase [Thermoplasmata archaeon]